MVSFKVFTICILAAVAMVQYAPAPMIAAPVAAAVGGGVATIARNAGSIANGSAATANAIESAQQKNKRSFKGDSWTKIERPDNGQYGTKLAWQLCGNDLKKATVGFAVPEPGSTSLQSRLSKLLTRLTL